MRTEPQILRSAAFQPAVSPISNRQGVLLSDNRLDSSGCRLEALRYSRLETCATTLSIPRRVIAGDSGPKFVFGAPTGGKIKISANSLIVFASGLRLYLQRTLEWNKKLQKMCPDSS